jgi:hypothetical protein
MPLFFATFASQYSKKNIASGYIVRDVAQPGSAFAWGARGRWFESSRPDKKKAFKFVFEGFF